MSDLEIRKQEQRLLIGIIGHLFISFLISTLLVGLLSPRPIFARSGCCSWHDGVCSYQCLYGGTGYRCCDGTPLSSTCAPYYSSCSTTPPAPQIEVKTEKKVVVIPFKTIKENDPSLLEGTEKVIQQGKDGKKEITYKVTYTGGEKTSEEKISEKVVKQPTSKIIAVGTKKQIEEADESRGEGAVAGTATESGGGGGLIPAVLIMTLVGGGAFLIKKRLGQAK